MVLVCRCGFLRLSVTLCGLILAMLIAMPQPAHAQVVEISTGQVVNGNVASAGQQIVYSFTVTANQNIIFNVQSQPGCGTVNWNLRDTGNNTIFNQRLCDGSLEHTLANPGTYTLILYGQNGIGTGTYQFKLWTDSISTFDIAISDEVKPNTPVNGMGRLETIGEVDVYRFAGTTGQRLIVQQLSGPACNLLLTLRNPGGNAIDNRRTCDGSYEVTLNTTGTYTLTYQRNQPLSTGDYSFKLWTDNPQTFDISINDVITNGNPLPGAGNIESPGSLDVYQFGAVASQSITLAVQSAPGCDLRFILRNPGGNVITNRRSCDGNYAGTLPVSGIYTVTVERNGPTARGVYGFQISGTVLQAPPIASSDFYNTAINTLLAVEAPGVLRNDFDPNGETITAELMSTTSRGTLQFATNGSFSYTPDPDFAGTDIFTYRARDASSASNIVLVRIRVGSNTPPVAENDTYVVNTNLLIRSASAGVLANDTDVNGDALTAILVSSPTSGTLAMNPDGSFIFIPAPATSGTITFTYQAYDGYALSNLATVTLDITTTGGTPTPTPTGSVTPTVTPTPSVTPTSSPPTTNLLRNGSFEQAGANNRQAANWTPNNLTQDRRRCNANNANFARDGQCVFIFTGQPGQVSTIAQVINSGVDPSDVLNLRFWAFASNLSGNARVQVRVRYTDSTPPTVVNLRLDNGSYGYREYTQAITVAEAPVRDVRVIVVMANGGGLFRIDAISLSVADILAIPGGLRGQ